jgi:hypothetical protein
MYHTHTHIHIRYTQYYHIRIRGIATNNGYEALLDKY